MIIASGDGWHVARVNGLLVVTIDRAIEGATFGTELEADTRYGRISAQSAMLFEANKRIEKKRVREAFGAEW